MAVSKKIPRIDMELQPDSVKELAAEIVKVIKPNWNQESLLVEPLNSKGYLNAIYMCRCLDEPNDNSIIIRSADEFYLGPFEPFNDIAEFLSENKLGVPIIALFANGFVMEYVEGKPLDWGAPEFYERGVWEKVAEEIAAWHSEKVYQKALKSGIREKSVLGLDLSLRYDEVFNSPLYDEHRPFLPTRAEVNETEMKLLKEIDNLEYSFCHVDLNAANFILTDNAADITLVDYDYVGINFRQGDLAFFFRSFTLLTDVFNDDCPGKEYEINFIRHYLKCRKALDSEPEPSEDEVTSFYRSVQKMKLLIDLRYIVMIVVINYHDDNKFSDLVEIAKNHFWKNFAERKEMYFESVN